MDDSMLTASCYGEVCNNYNEYYRNAVTQSRKAGERKVLHDTKEKIENKNIEIIRLLYCVGLHVTSIGFYYFYDAIHICIKDVLAATNAQKNIYMVLADKYGVSHKSIERAMRIVFTDAVSMRATQLFEHEMHICQNIKGDSMNAMEFICLAALRVANSY